LAEHLIELAAERQRIVWQTTRAPLVTETPAAAGFES
jgi:hypothetical protein